MASQEIRIGNRTIGSISDSHMYEWCLLALKHGMSMGTYLMFLMRREYEGEQHLFVTVQDACAAYTEAMRYHAEGDGDE